MMKTLVPGFTYLGLHHGYLVTGQLEFLFLIKLEKIPVVELWRILNEVMQVESLA